MLKGGPLVPMLKTTGASHARNTFKGTLLGTPNREPREYSRYIIGIYLLYSWGSLFGVPSRVPLSLGSRAQFCTMKV